MIKHARRHGARTDRDVGHGFQRRQGRVEIGILGARAHEYERPFGVAPGQLPEQPLLVKAKYVSKLAESKIKEVGGAVELVA